MERAQVRQACPGGFSDSLGSPVTTFAELLSESLLSLKAWISQSPHLAKACTEDLFLATFLRYPIPIQSNTQRRQLRHSPKRHTQPRRGYLVHLKHNQKKNTNTGVASSVWREPRRSLTISTLLRPACQNGLTSECQGWIYVLCL